MQEIISVSNLSKSFSGKTVFHSVNMSVKRHEPVVVMGYNGCGKSTLLKIIAGVLAHTDGEVKYSPNIKISYIPDRFPKLPFTVEDYLMHMGRIQGVPDKDIDDYTDQNFDRLKMPQDFRKKRIDKCSKGTIQKINILQALITKTDLLVLDEPFAGLDKDSENNLIEMLMELVSSGVALVLACHERKLAQMFTDKIYLFKDQECHVIKTFIAHYYVKFHADEHGFSGGDLFAHWGIKADGFYEALVEKDKLKEALEFLLAKGYELHSVNPK